MEHRFNFFRVCILYCFFSILPSYGPVTRRLRDTNVTQGEADTSIVKCTYTEILRDRRTM
jgi:hypothetical protein